MPTKALTQLKVDLIAALDVLHALRNKFDAAPASGLSACQAQQWKIDAAEDRCLRLCDDIIRTTPSGPYRAADRLVKLAAICIADAGQRLRAHYAGVAADGERRLTVEELPVIEAFFGQKAPLRTDDDRRAPVIRPAGDALH
jgi:hypothetical protein